MAKRLSGTARRELIAAVRGRYLASTPPVKREILREFAAITGYHRKSAIRILNGSAEDGMEVVQRPRLRIYDSAFCTTLIVLWEASDRVCGKRLQALLPSLVPALERHGHLVLDSSARTKLLGVSAATIDRLLAEARGACDRRRARRARRPRSDAASRFVRMPIGTRRNRDSWRSTWLRIVVTGLWALLFTPSR
jgi:hypothetical protein